MKTFSRILLSVSATPLLALVALRIGTPERVVNQPAGLVLSLAWAVMLFLGLAEWKGVSIGTTSAGKPITLISALLAAGATNFALGLGFLSEAKADPILVLFFIAVAAIMLLAWWKIFRRDERE